MNEIDKNKLKFQLIMIFRRNIFQLLMVGIFSLNLSLCNQSMLFQLIRGESIGMMVYYPFWVLVLLLNIYTYLSNVYKETGEYFMSIGYTRKRYYRGTMISNLILSIITSIINLLGYMSFIVGDKLYKDYNVIPYMGFYFNRFTTKSWLSIIVITFSLITLIYAIANFISVITISNKILRIVINIIILVPMIFVMFEKNYSLKLVNWIFDINKSFCLTILSYTVISIILYALSEKMFMKIDIN